MKKILVLIFTFFIFTGSLFAAECSAKEKVDLTNDAVKVKASYEFKEDEYGTYFLITIYNLNSNLFVSYVDKNNNSNLLFMMDNENPSFKDYDTSNIFRYTFTVFGRGSNECSNKLLSFNLVKPKRNKFYDSLSECRVDRMKDYYYCKEWLSSDFYVDDSTIANNIIKEFNKTTTVKYQEEYVSDDYMSLFELFLKYKNYILGFILLLIIGDIVYIFIKLKNIKQSEF